MSPKEAQSTFSIAGKIFILGEYAVLSSKPAVVATLGPRFGAALNAQPTPFAEASPAGRLISWAKKNGVDELRLHFQDPYQGAGGFGASTAQFALLYRAYAVSQGWTQDWNSVLKLYRMLTETDPVPPSGADLVAQWQGGVSFYDPFSQTCWDLNLVFDWSKMMIFSATEQEGRKVATHEHLGRLAGRDFSSLGDVLFRGVTAIQARDTLRFGKVMDEYAERLCAMDLELSATTADRKALRALPGVVGVKGAGAMQADALLVLFQGDQKQKAEVIRLAESRGLKPVTLSLVPEKGVQ